ncbi:hypothetical protein [Flavobacterium aquiphilum]|uniref:hypothetical protein n=1 Tax=Flavobacterium aquiphilum TaxID=3003261 RepID=UPI0024813559|nr:hypothetical protein [Flavobacterium aquiphilum]
MDFEHYLDKFKKSADSLDKRLLDQKKLEISIGIVLNSVYLKLYKREWTNDLNNPLTAEARIFFSVWVNEKTLQENKVFYNIHALKLRKLNGYSILSREFANSFRKQFKTYQNNWENVSVKFGPLTLMEGWTELKEENLENIITNLADNFIEICSLIDNTLKPFKQDNRK